MVVPRANTKVWDTTRANPQLPTTTTTVKDAAASTGRCRLQVPCSNADAPCFAGSHSRISGRKLTGCRYRRRVDDAGEGERGRIRSRPPRAPSRPSVRTSRRGIPRRIVPSRDQRRSAGADGDEGFQERGPRRSSVCPLSKAVRTPRRGPRKTIGPSRLADTTYAPAASAKSTQRSSPIRSRRSARDAPRRGRQTAANAHRPHRPAARAASSDPAAGRRARAPGKRPTRSAEARRRAPERVGPDGGSRRGRFAVVGVLLFPHSVPQMPIAAMVPSSKSAARPRGCDGADGPTVNGRSSREAIRRARSGTGASCRRSRRRIAANVDDAPWRLKRCGSTSRLRDRRRAHLRPSALAPYVVQGGRPCRGGGKGEQQSAIRVRASERGWRGRQKVSQTCREYDNCTSVVLGRCFFRAPVVFDLPRKRRGSLPWRSAFDAKTGDLASIRDDPEAIPPPGRATARSSSARARRIRPTRPWRYPWRRRRRSRCRTGDSDGDRAVRPFRSPSRRDNPGACRTPRSSGFASGAAAPLLTPPRSTCATSTRRSSRTSSTCPAWVPSR